MGTMRTRCWKSSSSEAEVTASIFGARLTVVRSTVETGAMLVLLVFMVWISLCPEGWWASRQESNACATRISLIILE